MKLIETTEALVRKKKSGIAIKILNFVESLNSQNYLIKTEFLLVSGKFFKSNENYDKALLAFEECLYLANFNEDYKLKAKTIVQISACYLQKNDLPKVIFYYHKLIDIESDLLNNTKSNQDISLLQFKDEIISFDLRVAIRQNLFTAHFRLGKLELCLVYLNDLIKIIDNQFSLNDYEDFKVIVGHIFQQFEFIQTKMDASIELCKLNILLGKFLDLQKILNSMLEFAENVLEKRSNEFSLTTKQLNSLQHFKIKCYSYMGICLAGLREFRFARMCSKKSLLLIEKEIESSGANDNGPAVSTSGESQADSGADVKSLILFKVECLVNASEACHQVVSTFKEMAEADSSILTTQASIDEFAKNEIKTINENIEQRITYAKEAYLLSKTLIDPQLRAQVTFNFAFSLYEKELYQSAAYYFNEVLSISSILLKPPNSESNEFNYLTDATPDFHLEASVYLLKCQLIADYFKDGNFI